MTTSELPPRNSREPVGRELSDIEAFDSATLLLGNYINAISSTPEFVQALQNKFWEKNTDEDTTSMSGGYSQMMLRKGDSLWCVVYEPFDQRLTLDRMKSPDKVAESVMIQTSEIDPSEVESGEEIGELKWGDIIYRQFTPEDADKIVHETTDIAVRSAEKLLEDFKATPTQPNLI